MQGRGSSAEDRGDRAANVPDGSKLWRRARRRRGASPRCAGAFGGLDVACARRVAGHYRRHVFLVILSLASGYADVLDRAWSHTRHGFPHLADQRPKILHAVRTGTNDD